MNCVLNEDMVVKENYGLNGIQTHKTALPMPFTVDWLFLCVSIIPEFGEK